MTNRTPGRAEHQYGGPGFKELVYVRHDDGGCLVATCDAQYSDADTAAANAAFIELAWNAFDDLLAACEEALPFVAIATCEHANDNEGGRENAQKCVQQLKGAIAQAKS